MAKPSRPGIPQPKAIVRDKFGKLITGSNISWQFSSNSENSWDANDAVSHYIGDIVEGRDFYCFYGDKNNVLTHLAPKSPIKTTYGSFTISNYNPITHTFTSPTTTALLPRTFMLGDTTHGTAFTQPAWIQNFENVAFTTHFTPVIADNAELNIESILTFPKNEYIGKLSFSKNGAVKYNFTYKHVDGENNSIYCTSETSNLYIPTSALLGGGLIEFYCQKNKNSDFVIISQYFTPTGDGEAGTYNKQSFLLGTYLAPAFNSYYNASSNVKTAFYLTEAIEGCWAIVNEMAAVSGRIALNLDLGDCKYDDASNTVFPVLVTPTPKEGSTFTYWDKAINSFSDIQGVADNTNNLISFTGGAVHQLNNNDIVQLRIGEGGSVPAGLVANKKYYVAVASNKTFYLKESPTSDIVDFTTNGGVFYINKYYVQNDAVQWDKITLNDGNLVFNYVSSNAENITLNAYHSKTSFSKASVSELNGLIPSLSNRFNYSWQMEHISGDFYITLSPKIRQNYPSITACDNKKINASVMEDRPVVAIVFEKGNGKINVIQAHANGKITKRQLGQYNITSGTHTYSLTVNGFDQKKKAKGMWIELKIDDELVGLSTMIDPMRSAEKGLGYYISMGVKSFVTPVYNVVVDPATDTLCVTDGSNAHIQHNFIEGDVVKVLATVYPAGTITLDEKTKYYVNFLSDSNNFKIKTSSGSLVTFNNTGSGVKILKYNDGQAIIYTASLRGLPLIEQFAKDDASINVKHFSKFTSAQTDAKSVLGQYLLGGYINGENYTINTIGANQPDRYIAHMVAFDNVESFQNDQFINPKLIEIKISSQSPVRAPGYPKIRIYSDYNNAPSLPLSDWIYCNVGSITNTVQKDAGSVVAYTNLVQFDVSKCVYEKTHSKLWLLVELPYNCAIATTNKTENSRSISISDAVRGVNKILNNNFEQDIVGDAPLGWASEEFAITVVNDATSITGKSLFASCTDSPTEAIVYYEFTTTTPTNNSSFVLQFDYTSTTNLTCQLFDSISSATIDPVETTVILASATKKTMRYTFTGVLNNRDYILQFIAPAGTNTVVLDNLFLGEEWGNNIVATAVDNLWNKCFAEYYERHDNVYHNAALQLRVMEQSHYLTIPNPKLNTLSEPTILSEDVYVDIEPPISTTNTPPALSLFEEKITASRISQIRIKATDMVSGILAFRVGHQVDYNQTRYTEWMPWSAFTNGDFDDEVIYTLHHFGTKQIGIGTFGINPYNMHTVGGKGIVAQVMDKVGNISTSNSITTMVYTVATVDSNPPSANINLIDPNSQEAGALVAVEDMKIVNNRNLTFKITNPSDITNVKDIRFREVSTGTWSEWKPFNTIIPYVMSDTEGLNRIEVQLRDYGNNVLGTTTFWEGIGHITRKNVVFNNAVTIGNVIYLAGIKTKRYDTVDFICANDNSYGTTEKAYIVKNGRTGATIRMKTIDRTPSLVYNGVTYTRYYSGTKSGNYYYIDQQKGYLVIGGTYPVDNNFTTDFTIKRETAVLYSSDKIKTKKIADFAFYNEQAILSMIVYGSTILMGGYSGKVYAYKNSLLQKPYITIPDDTSAGYTLPVNVLFIHQFNHESAPYIYAGTAKKTRLYRALLSSASSSNAWQRVATMINNAGDFTCATSAYNMIFLGTNYGKIFEYSRYIDEDTSTELEKVSSSDILSETNDKLAVSCLSVIGNQVVAGLKDRAELWNYTMQFKDTPRNPEDYVTINFDYQFVQNPAPWSYYSNGQTNTLAPNANVKSFAITDLRSPTGFKDVLWLDGQEGKITTFSNNKNSEWQQIINGKENWLFEIDMMNVTGTGRQGFQVADGRYILDVHLDTSNIYVKSGKNFAKKSLFSNSNTASLFTITFPYSITKALPSYMRFPDKAIAKIWNYSSVSTDNKGPYFANEPDNSNSGSTTWLSSKNTSSVAYGTVAQNPVLRVKNDMPTSLQDASYSDVLKVMYTSNNPRIYNTDTYKVDTQTKILARIKYVKADTDQNFLYSKVRLIVDSNYTTGDSNDVINANLDICQYVELPLQQTDDFHTYEFTPAWHGDVKITALEFVDLPNSAGTIYIDYIAVVTDAIEPNVSDNLTAIRVGVIDRDVKIWVGRNEKPVINLKDFLSMTTDKQYIKFGKMYNKAQEIEPTASSDTTEAASSWIYGRTRFISDVLDQNKITNSDFNTECEWLATSGMGVYITSQDIEGMNGKSLCVYSMPYNSTGIASINAIIEPQYSGKQLVARFKYNAQDLNTGGTGSSVSFYATINGQNCIVGYSNPMGDIGENIYTIDVPESTEAQTVEIGFRGVGNFGYYYIDNISLRSAEYSTVDIEAPVYREINDFKPFAKFVNTGGISNMFYFRGGMWITTNGLPLPGLAQADRFAKVYTYKPATDSWAEYYPRVPIVNDVGVGKIFSILPYKSSLVIVGQQTI